MTGTSSPVHVIFEAAASVLRDRGERASQRAVSEALGLGPTALSRYMTGGSAPTLPTLQAWLAAWEANGYPPLAVTIEADSVRVSGSP